jgi:hypothetical protein
VPEHEPRDIAKLDTEPGDKPEIRAAREEGTTPRGLDSPDAFDRDAPRDSAEAASESMTLERFPDAAPPPPGRQRTGDPPAAR